MPFSLLSSVARPNKKQLYFSTAIAGIITITAVADSPPQASFICSGSSTTTQIIATCGSHSTTGNGTAGSSITISSLTLTSTTSSNTIIFTAYNNGVQGMISTTMYLTYNTSAGTNIPNRSTMYNYNLTYSIVGGGGNGVSIPGFNTGDNGSYYSTNYGGGSGGYLLNHTYTTISQIQNYIAIIGLYGGGGFNSLFFFNNSLNSSFNGFTAGGGGSASSDGTNKSGPTGGGLFNENIYQIGQGNNNGIGAGNNTVVSTGNSTVICAGNTGGYSSKEEGATVNGGSSSGGTGYGGGGQAGGPGQYDTQTQPGSSGYSGIFASKFISFTSNSTKSDIGFVSISSSGLILTFVYIGAGSSSTITMADSTGTSLATASSIGSNYSSGTYTLSGSIPSGTIRRFYLNNTGLFNSVTNPYVSITFGYTNVTLTTATSLNTTWICYRLFFSIIGGGEGGFGNYSERSNNDNVSDINNPGSPGSSGGLCQYSYTSNNHTNISFQNISIGRAGLGITPTNGDDYPARIGGTTTMNLCTGSSSNNSNIIATFSSTGGGTLGRGIPGLTNYYIYENTSQNYYAQFESGNTGSGTTGGQGLQGNGTGGNYDTTDNFVVGDDSKTNSAGYSGTAGGISIIIYYIIVS